MEAWSSLRSRLHRLAQEPPFVKYTFPGHDELYAALTQHKLQFQAQVPCGCYWADTVLTAHGSSAAQAILMIERPWDNFDKRTNQVMRSSIWLCSCHDDMPTDHMHANI